MEYVIKSLTPDLAEDYFDFFDNRAFSDGSPFYPCYCNAFNLSKERMKKELYQRAEEYGNDWKAGKEHLGNQPKEWCRQAKSRAIWHLIME